MEQTREPDVAGAAPNPGAAHRLGAVERQLRLVDAVLDEMRGFTAGVAESTARRWGGEAADRYDTALRRLAGRVRAAVDETERAREELLREAIELRNAANAGSGFGGIGGIGGFGGVGGRGAGA
ncbi:hypothetical protein [Agromyces sp. LHK192]|uniref:hypothetical protein n=1 Tax=Agromyces sp. LHK192 TaxID=2498704 RepID=UPI000FD8E70F|nr:hypothetical protein [Agromyces sp. LHK192]